MSKRAPIVLGTTVAGLAGVLAFHTHATTGGGSSARPTPPASTPASSGGQNAAPASHPATRTVTGPVVGYGYGQLAVTVTLTGGRITDITVSTLQVAEPTSAQIADAAVPVLRREVLAAQSARIAAVSGATYTSEAYAQSLQAALSSATG
jgi:uncharacterized protein with FMN-binding domain